MVTKYQRRRRGGNVDSRHFDADFQFSGFKQHNSDASYPEPPPVWVWVVCGLLVSVATAVCIKEFILPLLDYLKGLL